MLNQRDLVPEESKLIYLGWLPKEFVSEMQEKVPGLYEKLSDLAVGDKLSLTEQEKTFFIDLVMSKAEGKQFIISNMITGLAEKIWGASSAYWEDPKSKKPRQENVAATFWWDFCSSNLEIGRVTKLVEFYLGTTKEEAERQASERHGYPIKLR